MSFLGLKRGTVLLLPHCGEWASLAEETVRMLRPFFGEDADYAHVGSTSIPGIAAKPILDIAVGTDDFAAVHTKVPPLEENGIFYRGEDHKGLLFVLGDMSADTRTHHIHIVEKGGQEWQNYIRFRDYLRANPARAKDYEALKQSLALRFAHDRAAYTDGKAAWIAAVLAEAAEYFR